MEHRVIRRVWLLQLLCFLSLWGWVSAQLRYSVLEEAEPGTVVGNVALDLGLAVGDISRRRLRLGSPKGRRHFALDLGNGSLLVSERIDRESLCGSSVSCLLSAEVMVDSPLELFRLEVEVLDKNDNAPRFPSAHHVVRVTELVTMSGTRFPLESAQDPDVGANSIKEYRLDPTPYFLLSTKRRKDGVLLPELVLDKVLDREEQAEHHLILTALDGGNPAKSGSTNITVSVLDVNDNAPAFEHAVYKVNLTENCPMNALLITLSATDRDGGPDGEIEYTFDDHTPESVKDLFSLNPYTGEMRVRGLLDFEETGFYEISIRARDHGVPELEGRCAVHVTIEDVNDNAPVLLLNSLVSSVPENTLVGTAVGLFRVIDQDSGRNGEVRIEIPPDLPFQIRSFENHLSLVTSGILDREVVSQYSIELTARDLGTPPLEARSTIILNISDVNDNPPHFSQLSYEAYIKENNEPHTLLCALSASDLDEDDNSHLTYSVIESHPSGLFMSSYIYINPQSGALYAQQSFDFEIFQVLHISVMVEDGGSPKLKSNTTVHVFVVDQNDNSPSILYPVASKEQIAEQKISRSVPGGHLVSKVIAVDPDSGYNAWLSYSIIQSTNSSLFQIAPHTGEIRTVRQFTDSDASEQSIVILIKDTGQPPLSTTVTVFLSLVDDILEKVPTAHKLYPHVGHKSEMTQYLIISLVVVSLIAFVTFILLFAKWFRKGTNSNVLCSPRRKHHGLFSDHSHSALHLHKDGTAGKYVEVSLGQTETPKQNRRAYSSPGTRTKDSEDMRPLNFLQLMYMMNGSDTLLSGTARLRDLQQVSSSVPGLE